MSLKHLVLLSRQKPEVAAFNHRQGEHAMRLSVARIDMSIPSSYWKRWTDQTGVGEREREREEGPHHATLCWGVMQQRPLLSRAVGFPAKLVF